MSEKRLAIALVLLAPWLVAAIAQVAAANTGEPRSVLVYLAEPSCAGRQQVYVTRRGPLGVSLSVPLWLCP